MIDDELADELKLLADADRRAASYLRQVGELPVFPDAAAVAAL